MADLKTLIKQGEGISVEFKECRRTLNRDVYKTVCAFLNRHGGTLLLGVADAGEVTGVDPVSVGQIKKADELGSGVRKLMKYGKAYGGGDPELVEGDIFRIIVKCPDFETPQADPTELRPESGAQSGAILQALGKRPLSTNELTKILGLSSKTGAFKRTIKELMDRKSIEYTIPDKPNSRLQKYRLTDAGKHLLKSMQK